MLGKPSRVETNKTICRLSLLGGRTAQHWQDMRSGKLHGRTMMGTDAASEQWAGQATSRHKATKGGPSSGYGSGPGLGLIFRKLNYFEWKIFGKLSRTSRISNGIRRAVNK